MNELLTTCFVCLTIKNAKNPVAWQIVMFLGMQWACMREGLDDCGVETCSEGKVE